MFKILGKECLYIDIADTFDSQILALSAFDEKAEEFKGLYEKAENKYFLNGPTEESCFLITVPDEYTPEQIQTMADVIMRSIVRFGQAPVVVDKTEQKYRINIGNMHEPELIGLKKSANMSSMEIYKPIFASWAAEGRYNPHFDGGSGPY